MATKPYGGVKAQIDPTVAARVLWPKTHSPHRSKKNGYGSNQCQTRSAGRQNKFKLQNEANYRGSPAMTSFRQIDANRRNARKSTGPITDDGKQRSRRKVAVCHGLTAETVIGALEDAEDYRAFEAAITADYDAQSAVERELVPRLASWLWQLRRATTIETGLFEDPGRPSD